MGISTAQHASLSGLYAIADTSRIPADDFLAQISAALRGGARLVQYRDKSDNPSQRHEQASQLLALCRQHDVPLIINDDYKLCAAIGAHGVHLGRDDAALAFVRSQLGPRAIIGASCYNALALAETAAERGADYIAFGAFYPSSTKPDAVRAYPQLLAEAKRRTGLPVCAIGGIELDNAGALVDAGADMLAVIGGLFRTDDTERDVQATAQSFAALFESR